MSTNPYPDSDTIKDGATNQAHHVTGQSLWKNQTSKPAYVHPPSQEANKQKNYAAADKFAPKKDLPTTADAVVGLLSLPSAIAAVDPQGLSSIAPMMYPMLGQISSASSGSSQSSRKRVIQDALTGALNILANKYGFDAVVAVFDTVLSNGGLDQVTEVYRDIVVNALANLYQNFITYGAGQLPESSYDTVTEKMYPPPDPVVSVVPDLYVQQYYTKQNDPYPGYIQWLSPDFTQSVFTERTLGDTYYSNADEEIYSIAEKELALALDAYIVNKNLTVVILNKLMAQQDSNVDENTQEKTSGTNVATEAMNLLMQLSGYAGTIANLQQSIQLPVSVLNQGSIKKSHQNFLKNIAQLRQEKEKAKKGAQPASPLSALNSALGAVSGVTSAVSGITSAVSGVTSAVSTVSGITSAVSGTVSQVTSFSTQAQSLYNTIKNG